MVYLQSNNLRHTLDNIDASMNIYTDLFRTSFTLVKLQNSVLGLEYPYIIYRTIVKV